MRSIFKNRPLLGPQTRFIPLKWGLAASLLLPLAAGLVSCSDDPKPQLPPKQAITATIIESKPVQYKGWEKIIGKLPWDFEIKKVVPSFNETEETHSLLILKNSDPLNEESFSRWLIEWLTSLPRLQNFPPLKITAHGENNASLQAEILPKDHQDYLDKLISKPELLRRTQIKTIETVASLKIKSEAALQNNNAEEALPWLASWVDQEPKNEYALSLYGNALRNTKKYWESIEIYKRILEINSASVFALHNLAYVHELLGAFDDAISAYKKAVALDPNFTLVKQLAQCLEKNSSYQEALLYLGKARLLSDNAELALIEGNIYRDQKKYSDAKAAYLKGYQMNPKDAKIIFNLILIDLDQKNIDDAKKKFLELKEIDAQMASEFEVIGIF